MPGGVGYTSLPVETTHDLHLPRLAALHTLRGPPPGLRRQQLSPGRLNGSPTARPALLFLIHAGSRMPWAGPPRWGAATRGRGCPAVVTLDALDNIAKVGNKPTWPIVAGDDDEVAPDSREEIYAQLRDGILDGSLRGRLPTREVLAARHRVSVETIGRVIDRLKSDGLVVTRGGRGTWVARRE